VAFEFRWRTKRGQFLWDWAFSGGSFIAAVAQGLSVGALVQGIPVANRAYAGGWWDWLTPFSMLTSLAVVVGYCLLGATWLILKTEGDLQDTARRQAWVTAIGTLALIGGVSLWTPFLAPVYFTRWFAWPAMIFSAIVPLLVVVCAYGLYSGLRDKTDIRPFLSSLGLFVLCFAGLGISFYPFIVPPSLSIWDAAAPLKSLGFLLVGAVVLMPLILAYTAYSYWIFRGKVDPHEGYH
jgi:cytochrome bd ubiquinol oxidase subunit II